jgi:hypothetical protein
MSIDTTNARISETFTGVDEDLVFIKGLSPACRPRRQMATKIPTPNQVETADEFLKSIKRKKNSSGVVRMFRGRNVFIDFSSGDYYLYVREYDRHNGGKGRAEKIIRDLRAHLNGKGVDENLVAVSIVDISVSVHSVPRNNNGSQRKRGRQKHDRR